MSDNMSVPFGAAFGASLVLSWTMVTAILGLAAWSGDRTVDSLTRWLGLWVFTVAAPTLLSLSVHRALGALIRSYPDIPRRIRRDLAHARWAFLMFGTMAVLSAFALGLG